MMRAPETGSVRVMTKAAGAGAATLALYAGLFFAERPLLELASRGGWYFLVPVGIAFIFSLAHGAFTGYFWDLLGVKPRK